MTAFTALLLAVGALVCLTGAAHGALQLVRLDALDRVFPDRWPEAAVSGAVHVPWGAVAPFQFAVGGDASACRIGVSPMKTADGERLRGQVRIYELLAVPVEANNNGGSKTAVGVEPRPEWLSSFIRKAPFEVAEVLIEGDRLTLQPGRTQAFLVDVHVARDAEPGLYEGVVTVLAGDQRAECPINVRVHPVTAPEAPRLDVHIWFWPQPENLTNEDPPGWWSERHWRLIENSGRVLREFGQNCILTPLIDGPEPLIRTLRRADGTYAFDYTRFDRWMRTFDRLGFQWFMGHHAWTLPHPWVFGGMYVFDERTGESEPFMPKHDAEQWFAFLPGFYRSLSAHLAEHGWTERYIQHQLDEPKDAETYARLAALTREYVPGVRTMDAINSAPEAYSPLVDIQVFAISILAKQRELAAQRRAAGQGVWLYHCCSPYPPYPNRHLDERLPDSRLYPWLAYLLDADGYLNWAANIYRGADPYQTSIGPVPSGSQDPGHPPGDNWLYYPGPDGLRGSLRQVAFRDGLLDHALLNTLAATDRERADEIMASIARSLTDYETDPVAYHRAREALLEAIAAKGGGAPDGPH